MAVDIESFCGGGHQRVGRCAHGHNDHIHVEGELRAGDGHRAAASGGVGFAQLHTDALHTAYPALVVAENADGVAEQIELHALLLGVVHLFSAGGQLLFRAAIDDVHLRAQPYGRAGGIHSHVAAADDCHTLAHEVGCLIPLLVGEEQIVAREELVGGDYSAEILALNVEEIREAGAGAEVDGVVPPLVQQVVHGDGAPDDDVALETHPQFLDVLHLVADHFLLGQTKFGDAVHQHAAELVQGFEDGDVVALHPQFLGAGKAGGTAADDGDFAAVVGTRGGEGEFVLAGPVADEALQLADGDGIAFAAQHALALALCLLRANTSADGRQRRVLVDDARGLGELAFRHRVDEGGNVDLHRATRHALRFLAVEAAAGLRHSLLLVVAVADLLEVVAALLGGLLAHGHTPLGRQGLLL